MLNKYFTGIRRYPLNFIKQAFIAYATIWIILEPLLALISNMAIAMKGFNNFIVILLISIVYSVYVNRPLEEILLHVPDKNSKIRIKFGDIFDQSGIIVIPVSRYQFETDVFKASLQGQLIQKFHQKFEGNQGLAQLTRQIKSSLENKSFDTLPRRATDTELEHRNYPLGTISEIALDSDTFFLFSLTNTEREEFINDKNCSVIQLFTALDKFWEEAKKKGRGNDINIPLIGGGVSGIRLNPTRLLHLNLLVIVNALEQYGRISLGEIRISLHHSYFEHIDLKRIKHSW